MKIVVNETVFNDSTWSFNHERGEASLAISSDASISEIAAVFDGDDTIRAYDDNDNETGVWYVHSLLGVYETYGTISPEDPHPRMVVVTIKASALTTEAEESLNCGIDENMEAILELAGLIADMGEADTRITRIEGVLEGIPNDLVARFDAINNAYNALADRVARLENKVQ